jgi:outer membrane protein assembly factor BamA
MATRARIGIENQDGSITTSYHHWDGYPAGLGFNLVSHWDDADKLREAISLGDASHWGKSIGNKTDFDCRGEGYYDQNVYYGRDRGETGVGPKFYDTYAVFEKSFLRNTPAGEEFAYVLRLDGTWTQIDVYAKEVTHDAEDDIIIARADMIKYQRKHMKGAA